MNVPRKIEGGLPFAEYFVTVAEPTSELSGKTRSTGGAVCDNMKTSLQKTQVILGGK